MWSLEPLKTFTSLLGARLAGDKIDVTGAKKANEAAAKASKATADAAKAGEAASRAAEQASLAQANYYNAMTQQIQGGGQPGPPSGSGQVNPKMLRDTAVRAAGYGWQPGGAPQPGSQDLALPGTGNVPAVAPNGAPAGYGAPQGYGNAPAGGASPYGAAPGGQEEEWDNFDRAAGSKIPTGDPSMKRYNADPTGGEKRFTDTQGGMEDVD